MTYGLIAIGLVIACQTLAAQPSEQRRKLATVLLGYCGKLQPQTAARRDVPDHSISANLPLTHQEIDLRRRADSPERGSL